MMLLGRVVLVFAQVYRLKPFLSQKQRLWFGVKKPDRN